MTQLHIWLTVAVIAAVTMLLRFLPFLIFNGQRKTPKIIAKLSNTLPCAVMGMLVVYCLKDLRFSSVADFLPAVLSCLVVVVLHVWKRNTLLSILSGTVFYMLCVQFLIV